MNTSSASLADIEIPDLQGRIPILDGLRGLAIILVLMVHFDPFYLLFGLKLPFFLLFPRIMHCGVDLFFVLSGFLITGILWDTKGTPNYFKSFYARRTLRILPLYYTFLTIYFLFLFLLPEDINIVQQQTKSDLMWPYYLFLSNYTEGLGLTKSYILVVCWSLAVEEQFYLLWPVFVMRYSGKTLMRICLAGVILSPIFRAFLIYGIDQSSLSVGFSTFTRLDGLLTGAWLALALRFFQREQIAILLTWARRSFPVLLAMVIACIYIQEWDVYDSKGFYLGRSDLIITFGHSIFTLFFASLFVVLVVSSKKNWLYHFFCGKVFKLFGKYSYCLYLTHIAVSYCLKRFWRSTFGEIDTALEVIVFTVILVGLCLLVARISWVVIEKPFLKLKKYFPNNKDSEKTSGQGAVSVSASSAS